MPATQFSIDFEGIKAAAIHSARALLPELIPGGKFRSLEYIVCNPARIDKTPGSFSINYRTGEWGDFATGTKGGDIISWYAHARRINQAEAARYIAKRLGISLNNDAASSNTARTNKTEQVATPNIYHWGDAGTHAQPDEIRRHFYCADPANPNSIRVKVKIKHQNSWVTYYRSFRDGTPIGWQNRKPEDFRAVPYVSLAIFPFDPELKDDQIFWPEGEKDVETCNRYNLPAFAFGGAGDGLPEGIEPYLKDRHLVILADNDQPGRQHAEKKAQRAHGAGVTSIKIIHFPELEDGNDVSDFFKKGGTVEQLINRAAHAPLWQLANDTFAEQPSGDSDHDDQLVMRCMADIQPEKIEWLWPGRIAVGKQTLIGGEPGLGKSQVTAALAATVTKGGDWPCREGRAPVGSVIILSAEDDASDTIRPRLDAAGADVNRVHLISAVSQRDGNGRRTFNLQADLKLLERVIKQIGDVRLVIIDPVSSYLGKTDSHKNAEVRSTLEPLGEMAARLRTAVVAITHFSKGAGQSAVNSFIGSIAFIATARTAFIVTRDPETEDDTRRLFVQAKNNIAADSSGLAFRVEQRLIGNEIVASSITWESEKIARTADEILAAGRDVGEAPERVEAEDFLRDILSGGPRPATEIEAEAKGAGLAWRTVRRAQKALRIKPYRRAETGDGLGKSGRWYWALPNAPGAPKMANFPYDGHVSDVATLGDFGHLSTEGRP
jgi:hypothetical protein